MLDKCELSVYEREFSYGTCFCDIRIKKDGQEHFLDRILTKEDLVSNVTIMDALVKEGHYGAMDVKDFVKECDFVSSLDSKLDYYITCKNTHEVLSELFGDYETLWNTELVN